uniref:Uncharacterized protein n=1 Tax=Tanacetum cinerariifolium TaxID=118510 RepID=A0A6L2KVG2_TANCI|nr:hypothetical protein [Tanacetum cinerariifolium]
MATGGGVEDGDATELMRMVVMVWCGGLVVKRRWGRDRGVWRRLWWVGRSWPKMGRRRQTEKRRRWERILRGPRPEAHGEVFKDGLGLEETC